MVSDIHHRDAAAAVAVSEPFRQAYVSLLAGAFLFAVGLAAAVLSLWHAGRYLVLRPFRR